MGNNGKKIQKVAIVTGGLHGIGRAITVRMLQSGYITCIIGRKSEEEVRAELEALRVDGEIFYFSGSISEEASRQEFVRRIMESYGRIDVLVNNAGVAPKARKDILELNAEDFDYVVNNNLKGTMFMTQCVVNAMLGAADTENTRRVIVNISSISAAVSSTNRAEYCVSKAGISMLTKLYADRLAREGIFVYEVQPGVIRTDMTRCVAEKYDRLIYDPEGNFPIHRWGTPEDVANVVSMLVESNLSYTTGQVICCDGGYMNVRSI